MTPQSEIRNARAKLRGIDLHGDSRWSHYYGEGDFVQLDEADRTLKTDGVEKVLKRLRPRSVLDIGSNTGRFSFMAARHGARVVALDIDEICINRLYGDAKQNSLDIHPLVTNIAALSGGDGLWRRSFPPATARLPCELVMALALTHHLVFRVGLKFEQIADALADFAGRALLVEFVPREDPVVDHFLTRYSHVPDYRIRFYAWYGIDNFKKALMRHFARIETLPSHPEPRTLLLCER